MNANNLRRAYSDLSSERKRNIRENDEQEQEGEQVVKQVRCHCCGIQEDCSVQYIDKIRYLYSGKWVCGLCTEVVTERCQKKNPPAATGMQEALDWHRGICEAYNSTTRVNPKLHFAQTMREIAKRSSQKRSPDFLLGSKIARSISCDPRLEGLRNVVDPSSSYS